MKKIFKIFALSFTCALFAGLGVACGEDEPQQQTPPPSGEFSVSFTDGEGFDYLLDDGLTGDNHTLSYGEKISFSLDVGAFYAGTPTVLANNVALPNANGTYTLTVKEDTVISVSGIVKDVSNMPGTGAHDDAFLITRPIDLVYIAEQVNAGNQIYSTAAYVLGNDIDCKGEELQIIGDLNNDKAFFSGVFSCYTNSETGEMERYTISNFVINSDDAHYVGLFGCVQTNLTTTSSGMFYGICLDNYTINVSTAGMDEMEEKSIYCGSLMGYGIGVKAFLCDATNGEINVFADDNYFAFAGGLIGCQQGFYEQNYNLLSLSEIAYAKVDVDVTIVKGVTLYAGGIIGYAFTNSLVAPAYIHNSFSTGTVSGALRSGGIAGGLSEHTSIASCYATGDVVAYAGQSNMEEYCRAYAGGIVGQLENDAIVNDCFFLGDTSASAYTKDTATKKYAYSGDFVGYADPKATASINAQTHAPRNCLAQLPTDFESLGFYDCNWVIKEGEAPEINYEMSAEEVVITLNIQFVTKDAGVNLKVNGVSSTSYSVTNAYDPIVNAFNGGNLLTYMQATATGENAEGRNYLSYGYFFDEACTMPVPYSFVTTKTTTLYVGFANYAEVTGDYSITVDGKTYAFTLAPDGLLEMTDGTVSTATRYQYDGKVILFENATFAQLFNGAVDPSLSVLEDPNFDFNRYAYTAFEGAFVDGELHIYDGVYFTKDAPLVASKGSATPTPAVLPTLGTAYYDTATDTWLKISGNKALLVFANGYEYELVLESTNTAGYYGLYLVQEQDADTVVYIYKTPYGYFYYDEMKNALVANLLDPSLGDFAPFTLLTVDELEGVWVSEEGEISFNGLGYHYNGTNYQGYLEIDGRRVAYSLDEDNQGSFVYNGTKYEISYDALTKKLTVNSVNYERQDEFAKYGGKLVVFDKDKFEILGEVTFDGKSNLQGGGTLTMPSGKSYSYKDGSIFNGEHLAGTITLHESGLYYELVMVSADDMGSYDLFVSNPLMGDWAMGGEFSALEIGPADLNGVIYAKYRGVKVEIEYLDPEVLYFETVLIGGMPVSYYMFLLHDEQNNLTGFAMSEYSSLAYNSYTICSKADNFFGTWKQKDERYTMSFDGVAFDPSGRYSYGSANISYLGRDTAYYYIFMNSENEDYIFEEGEKKLLMWSQTPLAERTIYFTLVACDADDLGAYTMTKNGKTYAFKRVEVDSLFESKATDKDGVVYTFNGDNVNGAWGTVTASNGDSYSYKIREYKTNEIVLEFKDAENNLYSVTLDTSDNSDIKITIKQAE